jgi:uncharacterized protein (TIGR02145 family)
MHINKINLMKTIIRFTHSISRYWFKAFTALLVCFLILVVPSCQKDEDFLQEDKSLKSLEVSDMNDGTPTIYYGHMIFSRTYGEPLVKSQIIENPDFNCFDGNFVLKIQNGDENKMTRVSSAEIIIDGVRVLGPSDFSKNVTFISKKMTGLTPESVLKVKLNSAPGSFIDLWIEGNYFIVTPTFTQIGPLLHNSVAPELPLISENGIEGTWEPETINTSIKGIYTFTFTPNEDQCGTTATMIINIGVVADVESNLYDITKIGDQMWMVQNLKTTHYNNGDVIGTTTSPTQNISGETEPEYQWAYNGNEDYVATYGRLYTWYAVTDSRGVCPTGWHLPSDAEWTTLNNYLVNNGYGYEGSGTDIAKSLAAKTDWLTNATPGNVGNDLESNNSTGFSALPGGYRVTEGAFKNIGGYASWWSSTEVNTTDIWVRNLRYNLNFMRRANTFNKMYGASVRCMKDN